MNHKPLQVDDLFQAYMRERLPSEATIHGYKRLFSVFFKDTNVTEVHAVTKSVVLTWRDLILTRAPA